MNFDVIVIGAGTSAGFLLAFLAEQNAGARPRVLVLDKNSQPFRKVYASGNGRCNFSNTVLNGSSYYSVAGIHDWQRRAFEAAAGLDLRQFLFDRGIPSVTDEYGRLMPYTNAAKTIGQFLERHLRSADVTFCGDAEATAIAQDAAGYTVTYTHAHSVRTARARAVVYAGGGSAYPQVGTDGSGFALLRALGHTVTPLAAGIVPLETSDAAFHALAGLKLECRISVRNFARKGELLFTKYGISGPNVLFASNVVSLALLTGPVTVALDVLPEELFTIDYFRSLYAGAKEKTVTAIFGGVLRGEFISAFLKHTGISDRMSLQGIDTVYRALKQVVLTITRTRPLKEAQVSLGGVTADELDPVSFESRLHKNLFVMGEAMDYTGGCGGYNIHWCAATARAVAGRIANLV